MNKIQRSFSASVLSNIQYNSKLVSSNAEKANKAISDGNIKEALFSQASMMLALSEQLRWLGLDGDQAEQLSFVLNGEAVNPRLGG